MGSDIMAGLIMAGITAIGMGLFPVFRRLEIVSKTPIRPEIFNGYSIFGAIVVSILAYFVCLIISKDVSFTYLGVISGLLLVIGGFSMIMAVSRIGVALFTCIQTPVGIATGMVETIIADQSIQSLWLTILGAVLLSVGTVAAALLPSILRRVKRMRSGNRKHMIHQSGTSIKVHSQSLLQDSMTASLTPAAARCLSSSLKPAAVLSPSSSPEHNNTAVSPRADISDTPSQRQTTIWTMERIVGIFFSAVTGILMSSVPYPSLFTDDPSQKGIAFMPSMVVGCLFAVPMTIIFLSFHTSQTPPSEISNITAEKSTAMQRRSLIDVFRLLFQIGESVEQLWFWRECMLAGVATGVIWSVSNVGGIYAMHYLSYVVVMTVCNGGGSTISTLIGVFYFHELRTTFEIIFLFLCFAVIWGGVMCVIIGVYGI